MPVHSSRPLRLAVLTAQTGETGETFRSAQAGVAKGAKRSADMRLYWILCNFCESFILPERGCANMPDCSPDEVKNASI